MSSAFYSSGLLPLALSRTCSSLPVVSHWDSIIRAYLSLGPSEGVLPIYAHFSKQTFFKVSRIWVQYGSIGIYNLDSLWAIPCFISSSAGMAPLSPGFPKLLSCTVTTFVIFLSGHFLGGDDNCMLSLPSSTCDLHICCCHSGEICQATAAACLQCSIAHCGLFPKD